MQCSANPALVLASLRCLYEMFTAHFMGYMRMAR